MAPNDYLLIVFWFALVFAVITFCAVGTKVQWLKNFIRVFTPTMFVAIVCIAGSGLKFWP